MKSILFVASEATPFIKSGGLADVIGSLPKSLVKKGHDVRIVIPMYSKIANKYREDFAEVTNFKVESGVINCQAKVYSSIYNGVIYYFIEEASYFEREGLYGYDDDGERFSFFQIAALKLLAELDFFPDVIHSHDWHTGMIPALCKLRFSSDERYASIKHIYTIHNLAFQGNFPMNLLVDCLGLDPKYYYDGSMRFNDGISFMKTAIVYADKISTVSPSYANEILTKEFGENLDEVLRYRRFDLWGIVNGIDTDLWNPQTDPNIKKNFRPKVYKMGKAACKKELQEIMGLRTSRDTMVVGMVSRLTYQKGVYLIIEKLFEIMGLDIQLVVLGTGEKKAEDAFKEMEYRFKGRASYHCGYNEELAHKFYAGCDLILMPSLFEPCGISQLIAMRYGTLSLVRECGGLKDTVNPYNTFTKEGNGFSFTPFNAYDLWYTLKFAVETYYYDKSSWQILIDTAMENDVSFEHSCSIYEELYDSLDYLKN